MTTANRRNGSHFSIFETDLPDPRADLAVGSRTPPDFEVTKTKNRRYLRAQVELSEKLTTLKPKTYATRRLEKVLERWEASR